MLEYKLSEDHANLKRQIKDWELRIDRLLSDDSVAIDSRSGDELVNISEEMMAVNI